MDSMPDLLRLDGPRRRSEPRLPRVRTDPRGVVVRGLVRVVAGAVVLALGAAMRVSAAVRGRVSAARDEHVR